MNKLSSDLRLNKSSGDYAVITELMSCGTLEITFNSSAIPATWSYLGLNPQSFEERHRSRCAEAANLESSRCSADAPITTCCGVQWKLLSQRVPIFNSSNLNLLPFKSVSLPICTSEIVDMEQRTQVPNGQNRRMFAFHSCML